VGDEGFVAETPVKDKLGPEAKTVMQILQCVNVVPSERLDSPCRSARSAQRLLSLWRFRHARQPVAVDGRHETRNDSAISGLYGIDKGRQAIHVGVGADDVVSRPYHAQAVEYFAKRVCRAGIGKQTLLFADGRTNPWHHLSGIAAGTLERAKSVGLQPKLQLAPPVAVGSG
jgi:hypothetical protein